MTAGTTPILEVKDLTVAFGSLVAVRDVTFTAARGSITSIIGPNGAGKSTLFNLVSGGLRPAAGSVVFDGVDVTNARPQRLVRSGLSRSFQITNLFGELTVSENLRLASQVLEPRLRSFLPVRASTAVRERVDELLEQFGLASQAGALAGCLSHGEQRRLEIAVALASRPKLLLLDEPTQGMSHGDSHEVARTIQRLAGEISILLIEHDIELVMDLSDHVIVLHQGAKLAEGAPASVRGNPVVQAAYFGTDRRAAN